jgi:hypothetical protein
VIRVAVSDVREAAMRGFESDVVGMFLRKPRHHMNRPFVSLPLLLAVLGILATAYFVRTLHRHQQPSRVNDLLVQAS